MKKNRLINGFIIGTFVMLYILVSLISTIHVIDFFELSNPKGMAIALAVAFEVGAAASLASLITLDKMNKTLVWALFIAITAMQMQGNMYYAFMNLEDYQTWSELFNLIEEEPLFQKRVLAFVSGAILPLIALGFIKSLVDYIKPSEDAPKVIEEDVEEPGKQIDPEEIFDWELYKDLQPDEELMKDFAFDNEDWQELSDDEPFDEDHALDQVMNDMVEDLEEEDLDEAFDMVEEGYVTDELLNQEFENEDLFIEEEIEDSQEVDELTDEDIETIVEIFEEEDATWNEEEMEDFNEQFNADELLPEVEEVKDAIDLVNSKEANEGKMPKKDLDASFQFGKNLYQTMVNKVNSDHLQVGSKPSQEEITQAYKNLGLINKRK